MTCENSLYVQLGPRRWKLGGEYLKPLEASNQCLQAENIGLALKNELDAKGYLYLKKVLPEEDVFKARLTGKLTFLQMNWLIDILSNVVLISSWIHSTTKWSEHCKETGVFFFVCWRCVVGWLWCWLSSIYGRKKFDYFSSFSVEYNRKSIFVWSFYSAIQRNSSCDIRLQMVKRNASWWKHRLSSGQSLHESRLIQIVNVLDSVW